MPFLYNLLHYQVPSRPFVLFAFHLFAKKIVFNICLVGFCVTRSYGLILMVKLSILFTWWEFFHYYIFEYDLLMGDSYASRTPGVRMK